MPQASPAAGVPYHKGQLVFSRPSREGAQSAPRLVVAAPRSMDWVPSCRDHHTAGTAQVRRAPPATRPLQCGARLGCRPLALCGPGRDSIDDRRSAGGASSGRSMAAQRNPLAARQWSRDGRRAHHHNGSVDCDHGCAFIPAVLAVALRGRERCPQNVGFSARRLDGRGVETL